MAQGWKFRTRRPEAEGGAYLQGLVVVHLADQGAAVAVIASKMPNVVVERDSEASPEFLAEYDIRPGEMLVLVEGK
jgi:hypothetical protein